MTEEDEEFQRLEREVEMRRMVVRRMLEEDDDIQDYKKPWVGLTLDERIELAQDVDWAIGAYCEYAEKIEARLREKNST